MPALATLFHLLRRALSSSAALALVMVIGAASIASGKTYAWCVPMDRAPRGCCPESAHVHPDPRSEGAEPTSVRPVCCAWRSMGELPNASARGEGAEVQSAPLIGLALPPTAPDLPAFSDPRAADKAEASESSRYGPTRASPRPSRLRRAALQVFHC